MLPGLSSKLDSNAGFNRLHESSHDWKSTLSAAQLVNQLDGNYVFPPGKALLISVHAYTKDASFERAVKYAVHQRKRLFFDETYRDPNVWMHLIGTKCLEWTTIQLRGMNRGKQMRVLHAPGETWLIFFSSTEAQKVFNVKSGWMTQDEWFAVACIPAKFVHEHIQLANGRLPSGEPYKLVPVPMTKMDMVTVDTLDILELGRRRRENMTEEEADKEWAKASEEAEKNGFASAPRNNVVYQELFWHGVTRFGLFTTCVKGGSLENFVIRVLVV